MEQQQYQTLPAPGCSKPFKACLVVLALVVVAFLGLLVYAIRMPAVRGLIKCQSNLVEVGSALRRYAQLHGSYPEDLSAIRQEYLKDPGALRCPLDTSPGDQPSYIYNRPGRGAGPDFAVLICRHHRFSRDTPPTRLVYLKKGTVKVELVEEPGRRPAEKDTK